MHKERLLAIEDDPRLASIIARVAQDAGFEPHTVSDAALIQRAYETIQPDVIVLDILMPDMDGIDVLNYLGDQHSKAKIIILSGSLQYRDMAEKLGDGRGLSIIANVSKPFRTASLASVLRAAHEPKEAPTEHHYSLSASI